MNMDSKAVSQLGAIDRLRMLTSRVMRYDSDGRLERAGECLEGMHAVANDLSDILATSNGPLPDSAIASLAGVLMYLDGIADQFGLTVADLISLNERLFIMPAEPVPKPEPEPEPAFSDPPMTEGDFQPQRLETTTPAHRYDEELSAFYVLLLPDRDIIYTEGEFARGDGAQKQWGLAFTRIRARDLHHAYKLAEGMR